MEIGGWSMAKVTLGIDLGTTNTVCCRFDNSLDFVKFKGKELLPSVLYYRDGKIMVGVFPFSHYAQRAMNKFRSLSINIRNSIC